MDAGKAILEACKGMSSPKATPIGEYNDFTMELSIDSTAREFSIAMKKNLSYIVHLGNDASGNITRIDNVLDSVENRLVDAEKILSECVKQYENAMEEMKRPFTQEDELITKSKLLDELNILLNMNEKSHEVISSTEVESEDSNKRIEEQER